MELGNELKKKKKRRRILPPANLPFGAKVETRKPKGLTDLLFKAGRQAG